MRSGRRNARCKSLVAGGKSGVVRRRGAAAGGAKLMYIYIRGGDSSQRPVGRIRTLNVKILDDIPVIDRVLRVGRIRVCRRIIAKRAVRDRPICNGERNTLHRHGGSYGRGSCG